ncbi:hypothetical protein NDU88_000977 [Pleurodeles waltl]|uniref:Uncharacterized protein n=1 Tax=Pleurodeles waltl TaxID=8319 RepID=A0AAV7U5M5_PLEWA|nr:hypothetical protein NDU88_000977 [Pleurodeles waltl]
MRSLAEAACSTEECSSTVEARGQLVILVCCLFPNPFPLCSSRPPAFFFCRWRCGECRGETVRAAPTTLGLGPRG